MSSESPFYLFDRESIGWLHRRHELGEEIAAADIARLLRADPANGSDPILLEYMLRFLEGGLPKKRGRMLPGMVQRLKLMLAAFDVEDRTAEIWAERREGKSRHQLGDLEPCVQAAEEVGRDWRMAGGRSLLNKISAWKNGPVS